MSTWPPSVKNTSSWGERFVCRNNYVELELELGYSFDFNCHISDIYIPICHIHVQSILLVVCLPPCLCAPWCLSLSCKNMSERVEIIGKNSSKNYAIADIRTYVSWVIMEKGLRIRSHTRPRVTERIILIKS